jgi:hypothetical protein
VQVSYLSSGLPDAADQPLLELASVLDGVAGPRLGFEADAPVGVAEQGGDAWLLGRIGGTHLAPYEQPERIAAAIQASLRDFEQGARGPERERLAAFERQRLAGTLAELLDEVLLESR